MYVSVCAVISFTRVEKWHNTPAGWALCLFLRPLFKDASGTLDKSARFSALYPARWQQVLQRGHVQTARRLQEVSPTVICSNNNTLVMFQVFSVCMTCRMMLYTLLFSSLEKWYCFSLFCQGCWYFRNRIASLRLRQALTLVYFPSSVLSLLSGQKRWPSCLWFWVIWMLRSITSHQISLVRLF